MAAGTDDKYFIPAANFNLQHLPESQPALPYLNYVKAVINLTVRLVIGFVSRDRPDNYPMFENRGQPVRSVGCGWVRSVERKFTNEDGERCPCPQCKNLPWGDRENQWGEFGVVTQLQVVFDDEESKHTQAVVDYNTDTDPDTCPKLHGVGVGYTDKVTDWCQIYVVSHDRDVCLMLEERVESYTDLLGRLKEPPKVCVSYPHDMPKHVCVEEYSNEQENWPNERKYTPCDCPGSRGVSVFGGEKVGEVWVYPNSITHVSGCNGGWG